MYSDPAMQRIMAAHVDAGRFAVFNLASHDVRDLPTGAVNGIAVDADDDKIFVAGEGQRLIVFDRKSLVEIDEIDLAGHADAITFDTDDHRVFIGHDGSPELWIIDAKTHAFLGTVRLDGSPSFAAYDPDAKRLLQVVDSPDRLEQIDPAGDTVISSWPTAPAIAPHGLAADPDNHLAFVAGVNGVLAVIDTQSGAVLSSCAVAENVDQIAYDAVSRQVYCASGTEGVVTVVQVDKTGQSSVIGDIATHVGAHTLTLMDSAASTDVWVSYASSGGSYLQCFSVVK
jgi:DNA-binding beta-propeller fold protein YncE